CGIKARPAFRPFWPGRASMAMMRRADTVYALDGIEDGEESSSSDDAPGPERNFLQQHHIGGAKSTLFKRLEPELWTRSFGFRLYLSVISLINVQIMALRADFGCNTNHCPDNITYIWEILENIITAFFVIDLIVRMVEAKPRRFFKGDETKEEYRIDFMNCFDFVIIGMRCFDLWFLSPLGRKTSGFKFASVFRIVHISQFINEIQMWKGFRELWIVISLLRETLLTLFWCGFLIIGTTWVMSVLITISVLTDASLELNLSRASWTKEDYWGSVGLVVSMFQLLLRDAWADSIVWPMVEKDPIVVLIFIVFYCVVVLALMNNVTGVVVVLSSDPKTGPQGGDDLIRFGKYKGQLTLRQVAEKDPRYVAWVRNKLSKEGYAQALLKFVDSSRATPPPPKPFSAAPPPRRVQQPARSTQTRSPARKASVTSGPNADFFELPRGLLDEFKLWSCPGNDWNRELKVPWVYNMKNGWRVVGEIIKARKLLVNLEDTSAEPAQRDTCQEISEKDLDELQYARYISALCEDEGKMNLPESRKVPHNGIKVEVQPKFRIRGAVVNGKAYAGVAMNQEAYAPPERNFGDQKAMASLVGLKVKPLGSNAPWFTGLVVCNESTQEHLTEELQQRLLAMTKTPAIKQATARASPGELMLTVSRDCDREKELKMTFVASSLRPCLSGQQQEQKLRKVKGWEGWQSLPPTKMTLKPAERQRFVSDEMARLGHRLFGRRFALQKLQSNFKLLEAPIAKFGKRGQVPCQQPGSQMQQQLSTSGPWELRAAKGPPNRLAAVVLGRTSAREQEAISIILPRVSQRLTKFGVKIQADPEAHFAPSAQPNEIRGILSKLGITNSDAVLFFQSSSLSNADAFHDRAKYECLVNSLRGQHVASQWFDLSKEKVWGPHARTLSFAVDICAVGLLAKLGHIPWALDARKWFQGQKPASVAVAGYDVCHLPRRTGELAHIVAAIRVEGEALNLGKVSFTTESVAAETVPAVSLRRLLPPDFALGRLVILHRDGEFPHAELESLRAYHEELAAEDDRTAFVLIECIKWAGGSPRLYAADKTAPAGTMLVLNEKEVLLSSSKDLAFGTANPLNLRLANILGDVGTFDLHGFAWAQTVFDLSYLHHGSIIRRPRLPITTHFADRLAYLLASAGADGTEWDSELAKISDNQAESVMASLRQIFREADVDGSGDLDREELRIALRTLRVRDRLKVLQVPIRDLEMLFLLLDEDSKGVIKCDYFFRGVSKLRGLAKAKDLHQLSIDLNRRMMWVDENEAKVSEVNDVLVDMVDALDELDTHIVKGDNDDRDPVVAARRSREPVSKGRILRGVWKDGRPMQQGSKNPWFDFEEMQKDAKDQRKKQNMKKRAEVEARRSAEQKREKKKRRDSDQPSPPPLPPHLQILKEERDRRKVDRVAVKRKKARASTTNY
ncbi:unnamed protein product, partial [Effrenium voratum]